MVRAYADKADKNAAEFLKAYDEALLGTARALFDSFANMTPKLKTFFFSETERGTITPKNLSIVPLLILGSIVAFFGSVIGGLLLAPSKIAQGAAYLGHLFSAAVQGKKARSWSQFWTTEADPAPTPSVEGVDPAPTPSVEGVDPEVLAWHEAMNKADSDVDVPLNSAEVSAIEYAAETAALFAAPVVGNVAVDAEREEAIRQAVEVPIADTLVTAFRNTPTPPTTPRAEEFPALSVAANTPVATRRQKQGGN